MNKFGFVLAPALALLAMGLPAAAAENSLPRGIIFSGKHTKMTMLPQAILPFARENTADAGLVTIFSNLASKYPKGPYWCCSGYNVMGPGSDNGEQWIAAAFTPDS